ncbi:hypothetical protein [Photorhabdus tasmaniensis]|uniref:Phage protein n=1 Tax=Photorhabdus tasmaniensis TaxID=1004159 RepID=A0ABX0GDP5_9GAMM|nr:hypothetical protein [Photorhabdus tasmaniensis]NHB87199.1 hypothetical protein [Photorhabdus tasmaniensis]
MTSEQIIVLALNGEAILMKNIIVTPSMQIQDKDQSGQASSTATAEQGIKSKELRVSGLIPFTDKTQLTRLFAIAEAREANGNMKRYRVAHEVAQAIKFREATFSGNIDAAQQTDKMAWLVNFTLKEYNSVAERRAARSAAVSANVQGAAGKNADADGQGQLSWFENVLKKIDTAIGPTEAKS